MTSLLDVTDLVVEYRGGGYAVRPVDGFDLAADAGELVLLLGPSGCGKTSILSALGGILEPAAGTIAVNGRHLDFTAPGRLAEHRRTQVGFVFQAFNLIPSLSARENVAMPLLLAGVRRSRAMRRADELLAVVGLADRAHARPAKLSGGQQQRVAIARGLAADPPILLADEPTANLDYVQAEGVISLLRSLRADGRLIVISTHDDRLVPIADRAIHLVAEFRGDGVPPAAIDVAPGEVIFEQGSRGELVYVVEAGIVEITRRSRDGDDELLALAGPGDYFGELGPLLGFPRSATARARTAARLTASSVADFRAGIAPR